MMRKSPLVKTVDPADWNGDEIRSGSGWLNILTGHEVDDLKKMASSIRPLLHDDPNRLLTLPKQKFDLGSFAPRLDNVFNELKSGQGLALIRGLPVEQMEPLDIASIYWGIGLHLGDATPNNPEGDMLGHITDLGKTQSDPNSRGYQTREAMDYHCDQCDIVGLICIRAAKSGGESRIASSVAMYNALVEHHPDYAQALTEPFFWTKHGEYSEGELPYYNSPVFNFFDGQLCTSFGPKHIVKGHDLPQAPALTDLQLEAIRVAEEIADQNRYDMVLEPGDMQFLNNYVALHTRSAYQDHEEPDKKRLLWRLWLMNTNLRHRTGYSKQWLNGVGLGKGNYQIRL
ncbi:MAG: hypothetical protein GKR97_03660 [Rhizobiaceae bacterium]|nr:hypothetical protein [Rhizobiaceae bacterium]